MNVMQQLKNFRIVENIGEKERKLRVWGGLALVVLALLEQVHGFLGFVGFMMALTGALRFCPGYGFLGKSSAETEKG